ncbi:hypothetical protein [Agromyces kandeliae]|uniref:Uncharacterized protein n=1 Tax=Agromyces kandeliae TaxID=2666141 RepID=A0A6L5QZF7_9MICO|nr:hypothetical protein [Agromyces kandeliae]MRX43043.1 hypothetical protein [Agromyces kandeliae]
MNHGSLQAYADRDETPITVAPHPLGGAYVPLAAPALPGRYVGGVASVGAGTYTGASAGRPGRYTDVGSA